MRNQKKTKYGQQNQHKTELWYEEKRRCQMSSKLPKENMKMIHGNLHCRSTVGYRGK